LNASHTEHIFGLKETIAYRVKEVSRFLSGYGSWDMSKR